MSDTSQGEGWWQASDGKWYPPEQAPGATPGGGGGSFAAAGAGGGSYGTPAKLDIGQAISYGWAGFTKYFSSLLIILLVMAGIVIVFAALAYVVGLGAVGSDSFALGMVIYFLFLFIGIAISLVISRGLIRAILAITEGRAPDPKLLWDFSNIGPYLIAAVLYSVIVGVGYMLCYIPGIVASFFLLFWQFAQVDGNREGVEAIKYSFELVKDRIGDVFILWLVTGLIMAVGAMLCGVGLIVAWPVAMIATGYAWKILSGQQPAPIPS